MKKQKQTTAFFLPNRAVFYKKAPSSSSFSKESQERKESLQKSLRQSSRISQMGLIEDTNGSTKAKKGDILGSIKSLTESIFHAPNQSKLKDLATKDIQLAAIEHFAKKGINRQQAKKLMQDATSISLFQGRIMVEGNKGEIFNFSAKSSLRTRFEAAAQKSKIEHRNSRTKIRNQLPKNKERATIQGAEILPEHANLLSKSGDYLRFNLKGRDRRLQIQQFFKAEIGTVGELASRNGRRKWKVIWMQTARNPEGTFVHYKTRNNRYPRRVRIANGEKFRIIGSENLRTLDKQNQTTLQKPKQIPSNFIEAVETNQTTHKALTWARHYYNKHQLYKKFGLEKPFLPTYKKNSRQARRAFQRYLIHFLRQNELIPRNARINKVLLRKALRKNLQNRLLYIVDVPASLELKQSAKKLRESRRNREAQEYQKFADSLKSLEHVKKLLRVNYRISRPARRFATGKRRFDRAWDKNVFDGIDDFKDAIQKYPFNVRNENAIRDSLFDLLSGYGVAYGNKTNLRRILDHGTFKANTGGSEHFLKKYAQLSRALKKNPRNAANRAEMRRLILVLRNAQRLAKSLSRLRYNPGRFKAETLAERYQNLFDHARKYPKQLPETFYTPKALRISSDNSLQIAIDNQADSDFLRYAKAGGPNWTQQKVLHLFIKHMGLPYLIRSGYMQKKEGKLILAKLPPVRGKLLEKIQSLKSDSEFYRTKWESIRADFDQSTQYKRYIGKIFDKNHLGDKIDRNVWQRISDLFAGKDARIYTMADTNTRARTYSADTRNAYFKKILRRVQGVTSLRAAYLDVLDKCQERDSQGVDRINPKKLRATINRYIKLAITMLPPNHKLLKIFISGKPTPQKIAKAKKLMYRAYSLRRSLSDIANEDTLKIQRELMLIGYSYRKSVDAAKDSLTFSNNPITRRLQQRLLKEGYPPLALKEAEERFKDQPTLTVDKKGVHSLSIDLGFGFEIRVPKTDFNKSNTLDLKLYKDGALRGTIARVPNSQLKLSVAALSRKFKTKEFEYSVIDNTIVDPKHPNIKLKLSYLKKPMAKKAFDLMTKQGRPLAEISSVVEAIAGLNHIRANFNPRTNKWEIGGQVGANIKLPHGFYLKPQMHLSGPQIGAGKSTDLYRGKNVRVTWGLYAQGGSQFGTPAGHVGTVFEVAWKNQEWDHSVRAIPFELDLRTMAIRFGISYAQEINKERNKQKLHKEALKKAGWDKIQNAKTPQERAELMKKDKRLGQLTKLLQKPPYNLTDSQLSKFFLNTISKELADEKDVDFWSKPRIAGFGVGIGGQISPLTGASFFIGAFLKINLGAGPNARTIILRTSTPDTKYKQRISNQKFQRILSREFAGENITYTGGTWESSNALINTMSRLGGQLDHSQDISFSSLYSLKKINERLAASNSAVRLEYDKKTPSLLKIVPYGLASTNLKIYLDPALKRNGLVLKNNQAYLAANRAKNIMFLERTISYPFQKDGALREKVVVITDNPHRFIDTQLDSSTYLFKKGSTLKRDGSSETYKFIIQRKPANRNAQNNILTYSSYAKSRNKFEQWNQINSTREKQSYQEKKDILDIRSPELIRRRQDLSNLAKNFFFDKKFKRYVSSYLRLSTYNSSRNFNQNKQRLMKLLSFISRRAGIQNINANELAYLETRMAAESFTNLRPGTRWISYLLRNADAQGNLTGSAKKYQKYFNRYLKTSYLEFKQQFPSLKGRALANKIAKRVELGYQRNKFESNLRAIRAEMIRVFSIEIRNFNKKVPPRAQIKRSAKEIANYLYTRMRQTDFTNPRIAKNIQSKDGYIVAPFTIRRHNGRRITGVRGLGYVHQDDVYKMLNAWNFNPSERGIRGDIAKLILERLSPSPGLLGIREMLTTPLAKKIFGLRQFRSMFGPQDDEILKNIYRNIKNNNSLPRGREAQRVINKFRNLLTTIRRAQILRGRTNAIKTINLPNGFQLAIAKFDIGVGTYERCGNTSPFVGEKFYIRRRTGFGARAASFATHVTPTQEANSTKIDLGGTVGGNLKGKPQKPPTIPPKEPQKGPVTTPGSNQPRPKTPQERKKQHDKWNSPY